MVPACGECDLPGGKKWFVKPPDVFVRAFKMKNIGEGYVSDVTDATGIKRVEPGDMMNCSREGGHVAYFAGPESRAGPQGDAAVERNAHERNIDLTEIGARGCAHEGGHPREAQFLDLRLIGRVIHRNVW